MAVNRRGVVVGTALITTPDPFPNRAPYSGIYLANATETHAFVWHDGIMKDLGTLGGPDSIATSVNNRGQVAGQSDVDFKFNQITMNPTVHPFVWGERPHARSWGFGRHLRLSLLDEQPGRGRRMV